MTLSQSTTDRAIRRDAQSEEFTMNAPQPISFIREWRDSGSSRMPYWLYTDPEIYRREQERIFNGPHWNYVALTAEIPKPGDFKRSWIGERSVIIVRDEDGSINVVENRCAHRGTQFCQEHKGNRKDFVCLDDRAAAAVRQSGEGGFPRRGISLWPWGYFRRAVPGGAAEDGLRWSLGRVVWGWEGLLNFVAT